MRKKFIKHSGKICYTTINRYIASVITECKCKSDHFHYFTLGEYVSNNSVWAHLMKIYSS